MDERIIDRKLFIDLANEVGLNASHIEAMGEMRHCEITVSGNMLERLVEIQHQFEQLTVMGDDEYRGFYIVVPRPTPEEWGDVEELIASGEYQSKEAFLADCSIQRKRSGFMLPLINTKSSGRFALQTENMRISS